MIREDRGSLLRAVLAALGAAVVGGVTWGLIVKWSDYEIGIAAWGIGFLVGMAVLTATRGARGTPFQAIAVVAALLGILIGKYLSFAWVVQDVVDETTGGAAKISIFSSDMVESFRESLDEVFGWIDLLWVGLAVFTAWRALAPEEPEPEPELTPQPQGEPAPGPGDPS